MQRVLRGRTYAVISGKNYRPRQIDMGWLTWVLLAFTCAYVLLSLVLPMGTLLLASFQTSNSINFNFSAWTLRNYIYVMIDFPTTRQAIVNSLILGVGTGTLGVIFATFIAIATHRSRSSGRQLLEQVTMLPQAFPRLIFAFGFLWMILTLPVPLYGTLIAVLLACTLGLLGGAFPAVRSARANVADALHET